jgi:REP element-mobilizing transposase RayT
MAAAKKRASGWGGRREGAGRKPGDPSRRNTPHRAREPHTPKYPVHVVLRRAKGLPSMASPRVLDLLRDHAEAVSNDEFRVLFAGAQADRVHLVVEADSAEAMTKGMWALTIRIARGFNKLRERAGKVWDDRYRATALRSVEELSDALASFAAAPDAAAIISQPRTAIARKL